MSHTLCWKNQSESNTPIMCCNVKHYFKNGSRIPDNNVVFTNPKNDQNMRAAKLAQKTDRIQAEMYCSSCDSVVDLGDPLSKNHLKFSCPGLPSTPLKEGFTTPQFARRMAALGASKKLYNHNFSPHKPTEPTQKS